MPQLIEEYFVGTSQELDTITLDEFKVFNDQRFEVVWVRVFK